MSDTPRTDALLSRLLKDKRRRAREIDLAFLCQQLEKELTELHQEYKQLSEYYQEVCTSRAETIKENVLLQQERDELRNETVALYDQIATMRREA